PVHAAPAASRRRRRREGAESASSLARRPRQSVASRTAFEVVPYWTHVADRTSERLDRIPTVHPIARRALPGTNPRGLPLEGSAGISLADPSSLRNSRAQTRCFEE